MPTLSVLLDYAGVAFLAASGAVAAAERRQDVVTFLFFGALTGVGGGTLRDVLLGAPVFWVQDPSYVIVCAVAALAVWLSGGRGVTHAALPWLDAVGLAAYAVVGSGKALALGAGPPVAVVMGVLTACFGGVLRDVIAEQPSVLMRREIYVTAALAAAIVNVTLLGLDAPRIAAVVSGVLVGIGLRAGALIWGWRLPAFASALR